VVTRHSRPGGLELTNAAYRDNAEDSFRFASFLKRSL
jgi:hypothetical protein